MGNGGIVAVMIEEKYKLLEFQIEKKRKEMIFLSELYGLNSLKVIKVSQELDLLIVRQLQYIWFKKQRLFEY